MTVELLTSSTPPSSGMSWPAARALAHAGVPVRRKVWPTTKTLVFMAGRGSTRTVAAITNTSAVPSTVTVVKNSEFGVAEFSANDWLKA